MNFQNFDLNLLRVLDALLIERSTVRAGQRIGLSQPAVSAALSRLRHAVGDPLFVRHGQGMQPTDVALAMEVPLRRILDDLENLLSEPAELDPSTIQRSIKISASDYFAELLMPKLADHLSRVAPGLRVQLVDLTPEGYVSVVDQTHADLALAPELDLPHWAESETLFRSDFVIAARQGHPAMKRAGLSQGDVVPLDLYCALGHVLFSTEGKLRGMGDEALARLGRTRHVAMTLPVFSGVCNAVAESDLIALVPTRLAQRQAPRLGLDLFEPPMPVPQAKLLMVWHKRSTSNPAHRWLRHQIARMLAPLDAQWDAR
jgi:DNA-binding transcriptional LysR family regulator